MATPKYPVMELSSPYGDCTETINHYQSKIQFSPPYGDGIKWAMQNQTYSVFSPPCGDRTEIAAYKALTA